ncbi:hexose kinase [bacterium]|nr:hexose kinase [bacterium]
MIHTVTFNPVIDLIYHVPNFQKGKTFRCKEFAMIPAGKGMNVSYALTCLEEASHTYAVISNDRAELYRNACEEKNIVFHPIAGHHHMRYHSTLLDAHDRTVTHIQTKGDSITPALVDELIDELLNNINAEDIVVLAGSLPPGVDPSIYAMMIDECRDKQAYVLLDTNGDALLEGVTARPFVLKINQQEAEELTKIKWKSDQDTLEMIEEIQEIAEIPFLMISLGARGIVASAKTGAWKLHVPMDETEIVDTVGCGDVLTAGFVYSLARKKPEQEIAAYAIACASVAAKHAGPGHFQKTEIGDFWERINIQPLQGS